MSDQPIRLDLNFLTRNLRHRTIVSKGCQYLREVIGAATSDTPMIDRADFVRLNDYLDDMEALIKSMPVVGAANKPAQGARPEVDTPLTRDRFYKLEEPELVPQMNNAFWQEAADRIYNALIEIAGAQTALYANYMHPSDPERWIRYLDALRYDLKIVIGEVEPLDTPSTEPVVQPIVDTEGADWNPSGTNGAAN
jgi:hypothetical protein